MKKQAPLRDDCGQRQDQSGPVVHHVRGQRLVFI